jgi:hypothetical protein
MSQSQAILAGAALIAVSILFINAVRPAAALGNGPYQLVHHSNTTSNVGIFKIDTSTGDLNYCYLAGSGGVDLVCTKTVR